MFPFSASAQKFDSSELELIFRENITEKMRVFQFSIRRDLAILRTPSKDINPKAKGIDILIKRMYITVTDLKEGGVGIAAPQVGINRNIIWVQRFDKVGEPFEVYLNPKILWQSKLKRRGWEGCLSIPDTRGEVFRSYAIEVEYQDTEGQKHTEKVEGFTAVVFQHEIDHLKGILFTDRVSEQEGKEFQLINQEVELFLEHKLFRQ